MYNVTANYGKKEIPMQKEIIEEARKVTTLLENAQGVFPILCYYEGWLSPKVADFDRAVANEWSADNPALPLWNHIENDLCRMTDYVSTLLLASGIDVDDIFDAEDGELSFTKGTLSRMISNQFRNALRQSTMDELIKSIES